MRSNWREGEWKPRKSWFFEFLMRIRFILWIFWALLKEEGCYSLFVHLRKLKLLILFRPSTVSSSFDSTTLFWFSIDLFNDSYELFLLTTSCFRLLKGAVRVHLANAKHGAGFKWFNFLSSKLIRVKNGGVLLPTSASLENMKYIYEQPAASDLDLPRLRSSSWVSRPFFELLMDCFHVILDARCICTRLDVHHQHGPLKNLGLKSWYCPLSSYIQSTT